MPRGHAHKKPVKEMDLSELQEHFKGHTRTQLLLALQTREQQIGRLQNRISRLNRARADGTQGSNRAHG